MADGVITPPVKEDESTQETVDHAAELETLKTRVAEFEQKATRYESMLLDPAYVEYVAAKAAGRVERTEARKTPPAEHVKFEDLSPKEQHEYTMATIRGEMDAKIQPLANNQVVAQAQQQVAVAAGKHKDYWEYKEEMMAIAQRHPTITAEEAYCMAKGMGTEKKDEAPKKVAPKSEAPTTGVAGRVQKQTQKGLPAKMETAWKEVFGNSQVAE